MPWRRLGVVVGWSGLLFVGLTFAVRALAGSLTDGVLIGTGVAIVWYTVETASLKREMTRQSASAVKQKEIAFQQAEAGIRPLLISRIERVESRMQIGPMPRDYPTLVLRNIGHGSALFVGVSTSW
jgi:hypothetical protein